MCVVTLCNKCVQCEMNDERLAMCGVGLREGLTRRSDPSFGIEELGDAIRVQGRVDPTCESTSLNSRRCVTRERQVHDGHCLPTTRM